MKIKLRGGPCDGQIRDVADDMDTINIPAPVPPSAVSFDEPDDATGAPRLQIHRYDRVRHVTLRGGSAFLFRYVESTWL